jgi:hypothetical protein
MSSVGKHMTGLSQRVYFIVIYCLYFIVIYYLYFIFYILYFIVIYVCNILALGVGSHTDPRVVITPLIYFTAKFGMDWRGTRLTKSTKI